MKDVTMNNQSECALCQSLHASRCEEETEPCNTIIMESEHFVIIPDRLPMAKLHYLVVSKKHYINSTDIVRAGLWRDFSILCADLCSRIARQSQDSTLLFEHGRHPNKTSGGKSVDHFHFHVVVDSIEALYDLLNQADSAREVSSPSQLMSNSFISEDYILACNSSLEAMRIITFQKPIPSQFMRSILYNRMDNDLMRRLGISGTQGYDWKLSSKSLTREMLEEHQTALFGFEGKL